jgi:nicotinamidase-related amidase
MNGFYSTNLDNLLRGLGVEKVVISGAWTNMSIEHTARHAADAGYEVVVVSDATSTMNDEWQHAALNYALTNVGEVGTTQEVLAALGVRAPARRRAAAGRRRTAGAARRR